VSYEKNEFCLYLSNVNLSYHYTILYIISKTPLFNIIESLFRINDVHYSLNFIENIYIVFSAGFTGSYGVAQPANGVSLGSAEGEVKNNFDDPKIKLIQLIKTYKKIIEDIRLVAKEYFCYFEILIKTKNGLNALLLSVSSEYDKDTIHKFPVSKILNLLNNYIYNK
jgi:hypothetical protein